MRLENAIKLLRHLNNCPKGITVADIKKVIGPYHRQSIYRLMRVLAGQGVIYCQGKRWFPVETIQPLVEK